MGPDEAGSEARAHVHSAPRVSARHNWASTTAGDPSRADVRADGGATAGGSGLGVDAGGAGVGVGGGVTVCADALVAVTALGLVLMSSPRPRLNHSTDAIRMTAAAITGTSAGRPGFGSRVRGAGRGGGIARGGAGASTGAWARAGGGTTGAGGAGGSTTFCGTSTGSERALQNSSRFCRLVSTNGCSGGNAAVTISHARR